MNPKDAGTTPGAPRSFRHTQALISLNADVSISSDLCSSPSAALGLCFSWVDSSFQNSPQDVLLSLSFLHFALAFEYTQPELGKSAGVTSSLKKDPLLGNSVPFFMSTTAICDQVSFSRKPNIGWRFLAMAVTTRQQPGSSHLSTASQAYTKAGMQGTGCTDVPPSASLVDGLRLQSLADTSSSSWTCTDPFSHVWTAASLERGFGRALGPGTWSYLCRQPRPW